MDVSTFSATLDALQLCANSVKPDKKKVRHALKNLCLYPQSIQLLPPLLTLFQNEMKNQSQSFKLLCYHIISYTRQIPTIPQAAAILPELANLCVSFKTPVPNMPLLLRVFFYMVRFWPAQHGLLVETLSGVFQKIPDQTVDKRRKGKSRSKAMEELILGSVREAIDLCIELKGVTNLGHLIVEPAKVQSRLIPWSSNFSQYTKLQLIRFLGSVPNLPRDYAQILPPDDDACTSAFSVSFLVNVIAPSKPDSAITSRVEELLESAPGGALSLLQVTLTRATALTDSVLKSVSRCVMRPNLSTILPLLELLIARPMLDIDKNVLIALYSVAGSSDKLLAFSALMCLSLLTAEPDWICASIRETLRGVPFTRRSACVQMLMNRWLVAIQHPLVLPMFWKLVELLLTYFSEVFLPVTFVTIVERIIVVGVVDEFVEVATRIVRGRPSIEAVTLLIHAVGLARGMAGKEAFDGFLATVQKYLEGADPLLCELCEVVLVPE